MLNQLFSLLQLVQARLDLLIDFGQPSLVNFWTSVKTNQGAPYEEFEKISLQTGGVARQLFTDSDTAQQLTDFYSEMAMPIIHNFKCSYKNAEKEKTLCSDSTLFRGQELFTIGKIKNCRRKLKLKVDENDVLAESKILGRFHLKQIVSL